MHVRVIDKAYTEQEIVILYWRMFKSRQRLIEMCYLYCHIEITTALCNTAKVTTLASLSDTEHVS